MDYTVTAKKITVGDIASALSRLFNLPADHQGLARFSGALEKTVNDRPEFRGSGLQGAGFASLALSNMTGDLAALLDPVQREKLQRELAIRTNPESAEGIAARAALGWNLLRALGSTAPGSGESREPGGSRVQGGTEKVSSTTYGRELTGGGPTYSALLDQGYKPAHITSAIDFARHIGASEDMARKFIKMDQSSRENLHRFVDDMRKNPAKTKEEENAKIEEFRKKNPDAAKHLTPDDIRKIIRGDEKKNIRLEGEKAPHEATQDERVAANKRLGIEKAVEARHDATVANLSRKPDGNSTEDAELAAIAKRRAAADATSQPKKAEADDKTTQPGPKTPKQASRSNPSGPKVV